MCRLFGFKGNSPTKLSFFLCEAENALLKQSILDSRNISNSQGWGIGFYQNNKAYIQKRASSASFDFNFKFLTDFIETDTMIAHIRDATVGEVSDHNAHPFIYQNWVFAHNGHIDSFDLLRPQVLQKIGPELAFEIMGSTDSEYVFYLFISKLRKKVSDITDPNIETVTIKDTVAETIKELNNLGANVDIAKPHKMNFIVSNGKLMVASRYGHSLYYNTNSQLTQQDVSLYKDNTNLKIRFTESAELHEKQKNDSIIIASEIVDNGDNWREVPEQCILSVDSKLRLSLSSI